jgi:hypothetical protein
VGRCVRHQPHSVWCSVVDHNAKRRLGCWSRIGCRHSCSSTAASTVLHSLHITSTNDNGKTTHQQQRPWLHVQHAWQTRRNALLPRGTISLLVARAHSFRAELRVHWQMHTSATFRPRFQSFDPILEFVAPTTFLIPFCSSGNSFPPVLPSWDGDVVGWCVGVAHACESSVGLRTVPQSFVDLFFAASAGAFSLCGV